MCQPCQHASISIDVKMIYRHCCFFAVCRNEIRSLRYISRLISTWETFTTNGRHYCVLAGVTCMYFTSEPLRAQVLYVMIGMFNEVRKTLLRFMLNGVRNSIQTKVSLIRMEVLILENLENSEIEEENILYSHPSQYTLDRWIVFEYAHINRKPTVVLIHIIL